MAFEICTRFLSASLLTFSANIWPAAIAADQSYIVVSGSGAKLPPNAVLEGSIGHGGKQPHYFLDYDNPKFDLLRRRMHQLRSISNPVERIRSVVNYVRTRTLRNRDYRGTVYTELMKEYREAGVPIPLSKYLQCQAGTCREDALILHYALEVAEIPNQHYYVKVEKSYEPHTEIIQEDHAFCVVEIQGEKFVIDSNSPRFNGFSLKALMSKKGITKTSRRLPFAEAWPEYRRRVIAVNDFPKLRIPVKPDGCVSYFSHERVSEAGPLEFESANPYLWSIKK